MSKVIKIAGKTPDNTVEGLSVSSEGELNTLLATNDINIIYKSSGTLDAGSGTPLLLRECKQMAFGIFVFTDSSDKDWALRVSRSAVLLDGESKTFAGGDAFDNINYLRSVSGSLDGGLGVSTSAFTGIIDARTLNNIRFILQNKSSQSLEYSLYVVGYPAEYVLANKVFNNKRPLSFANTKTASSGEMSVDAIDTRGPVVIEQLQLACKGVGAIIRIMPYDIKGAKLTYNSLGVISHLTGHASALTVGDPTSDLFDVTLNTPELKIASLNRYLSFPYGVHIYLESQGEVSSASVLTARGYAVVGG